MNDADLLNMPGAIIDTLKAAKDDPAVNYRYASQPEQSCGMCVSFQPPGGCRMVMGTIRSCDTCNLFEKRPDDGKQRAELVHDAVSGQVPFSDAGDSSPAPLDQVRNQQDEAEAAPRPVQAQLAPRPVQAEFVGTGNLKPARKPVRAEFVKEGGPGSGIYDRHADKEWATGKLDARTPFPNKATKPPTGTFKKKGESFGPQQPKSDYAADKNFSQLAEKEDGEWITINGTHVLVGSPKHKELTQKKRSAMKKTARGMEAFDPSQHPRDERGRFGVTTGKKNDKGETPVHFAGQHVATIANRKDWVAGSGGNRVSSKMGNVTDIKWNPEGLKSLFGDVSVGTSSASSSKDFTHMYGKRGLSMADAKNMVAKDLTDHAGRSKASEAKKPKRKASYDAEAEGHARLKGRWIGRGGKVKNLAPKG